MQDPGLLARELRQVIEEARGVAWSLRYAPFKGRAIAIEHIETHVLDRLEYLAEQGELPASLQAVQLQATTLIETLEARNDKLIARLHDRIANGRYTPSGLRRAFSRLADPPGGPAGYDFLDLLVGGLLDADPLPDEELVREADMVFYQPTPAREVLQFVTLAQLGPGDVVYDLGSGLGHVVILAALASGARAYGIEREPTLCRSAQRLAQELQLARVAFIEADVRDASLAPGNVFFLYTPFRGAILQEVLSKLQAISRDRPLRVCTYGPCTPEVATLAPWLRPASGSKPDEQTLTLFESCSSANGQAGSLPSDII